MPRFVAFLRGVSPKNAKMPELKRSFEAAGFTGVRTLLSSGNVVFDARAAPLEALARRAEKAMLTELGRSFGTFARPAQYLQQLLESDPFAEFDLAPTLQRVVTFLPDPLESSLTLPIERDGASILKRRETEVFSVCVPSVNGPALMRLLERSFGQEITTRTLDTVRKCAAA